MESGGEFLIFGLLLLAPAFKRFDGQIFGLYLVFYAVLRFIIEFFRGDAVRGRLLRRTDLHVPDHRDPDRRCRCWRAWRSAGRKQPVSREYANDAR